MSSKFEQTEITLQRNKNSIHLLWLTISASPGFVCLGVIVDEAMFALLITLDTLSVFVSTG